MSVSKRNSKPASGTRRLYSEAARKILSDSLRLKKGESVTIESWSNSLPLAYQLVIEAKKIGAIPILTLEDEETYVEGLRNMPKDVLGTMGKHEYNLLSGTDAYVFIPGPPLGSYFPKLKEEESAAGTQYNASWYEAAEKAKLRGVRVSAGYVGKDLAGLLGKSVNQVVERQLRAIVEPDFASIGNRAREIAGLLQDGVQCELSSDNCSLNFTLKGDIQMEDAIVSEEDVANGDNMTYVPPGYVGKRLDSASVSGKVKVSAASTRLGGIKDAILEFESGTLKGWESKSSKDKLRKIIDSIPEESRKLSLMTVGINPSMKYGYGQDRFVEGSLGLSISFRFASIVQKGSLTVGSKKIVDKGRLLSTK